MAKFFTRLLGLLLLTGAITITSCEAVFHQLSSADVPAQQNHAPVQHEQ